LRVLLLGRTGGWRGGRSALVSESLFGEGDQLFEFFVEILQSVVVRVAREGGFDLLKLELVGFEVLFVHLELEPAVCCVSESKAVIGNGCLGVCMEEYQE